MIMLLPARKLIVVPMSTDVVLVVRFKTCTCLMTGRYLVGVYGPFIEELVNIERINKDIN